MSQPPPPLSYPPMPYTGPYAGPPTAAGYATGGSPAGRRAGVLMFVTGGLLLLLGACNTLNLVTASTADLGRQMQQQQATMGQPAMPIGVATLRAVALVIAALVMASGLASVLLGTGVRRGSRGATVTALVLSIVLLAGLGLFVLVTAVSGFGAPLMWIASCVLLVPAAVAGLQVAWLVAALRNRTSGTDPAYQQYVAQWYQYQQAAQAYAGSGYGYATAPPAPAPPPLSAPPVPDGGGPPPTA